MNKTKRVLAALLATFMMVVLLPTFVFAAETIDGVHGFIESIEHQSVVPSGYTPIYNRDDLQKVSDNLSGNYILMNDIDMYYIDWTPIGTYDTDTSSSAASFSGIFDGNGYAIKNIDISVNGTKQYVFAGFFASLKGEVKNLKVEGSITGTCGTNVLYGGGIAAYLNESGKITNCISNVDVTLAGNAKGGGVAGECDGVITACYNYGAISAETAGGIAGIMDGNNAKNKIVLIYGSRNVGKVSAASSRNTCAGGIVGEAVGSNTRIERCSNAGEIISLTEEETINDVHSRAGGIAAYLEGTVYECWNSGKVKADWYRSKTLKKIINVIAGGICATAEKATIDCTYNSGIVLSNAIGYTGSGYFYRNVECGGIVGYMQSSSVTNSFNVASVSAINNNTCSTRWGHADTSVGGIVGIVISSIDRGSSIVKNCYNIALTSLSDSWADYYMRGNGSIVGYTTTSNNGVVNISNCYWLNSVGTTAVGNKTGSVTESRLSALTDEQMKTQESFVGFPFGYFWTMGGSSSYAYPELLNLTYTTSNDICTHENWGAWENVKVATCHDTGRDMRTCKECSCVQYRETDRLPHSWGEWKSEQASDCTSHTKHTRTCSLCGDVEVNNSSSSLTGWIIGKAATHTESGYRYKSCTNCNTHMIEEEIPAIGHTYTSKTVAPTCTERGYTEMACLCGDSYRFDYTKPKGHSWSEWELYQKTSEHEPVGRRECDICNVVEEILDMPMVYVGNVKKSGDIVTVRLVMENVPDVKSMMITGVTYDNSALEYIGGKWTVDGATLSNWTIETGGVLAFDENTDINGVIAELTFRIKDEAETGFYEIGFTTEVRQSFDDSEIVLDVGVFPGGISVTDVITGDLNEDGQVDSSDAIYLLWYTFLPEQYPINQKVDFNNDSQTDSEDAIYLLWYTFLPDLYPID